MPRGKVIYVSNQVHRQLKLLAARRNRSIGATVAELVEAEVADLANAWTSSEGLWLQQKALSEVWEDPALDVYNHG